MRARRGVMVTIVVVTALAAGAWGQGAGSIGMGWCPVCGRDMPQSHFPHQVQTDSGDGGNGGGGGGGNIFSYHLANHRRVVGWYNDGVGAYNRGQYKQAEQLFRQVAGSRFVFESKVWRMLGLSLEMQGRLEEALTEYNRACAHNALDLEAHRLRGRLAARLENRAGETLQMEGQWREAREKFRKAVSWDGANQEAKANLAASDRHVRYEEGTAVVQRIVNGTVVEVAAPAASTAVRLEPAGEWMFQKPQTGSAVDARRQWVMRDAPAAEPARKDKPAPAQGQGSVEPLYVQHGLLTRHKYIGGWPGPVDPDPRLPNPLDPAQAAREEALAGELDRDRFHRLDLVQALGVLMDRYNAAANRAARGTGQELEAELAALRQAGRVPEAGLLGAVRTDPAVAKAVDEAVGKVCRRESERVKAAGERFTADLVGYLRVRDAGVLAERKAAQEIDRLREDRDQALERVRRETQARVRQALEPLRKEGLLEEGQDPYARAIGDVALQGRIYDIENPIRRRQLQQEADLRDVFRRQVQDRIEQLRKEARP